MNLLVEWNRPIGMRLKPHQDLSYQVSLDRLPSEPGAYVFGREWGPGFEALYVGKAMDIRKRIHGQLNNLRLMQHIKNASGVLGLSWPEYWSRGLASKWNDACQSWSER